MKLSISISIILSALLAVACGAPQDSDTGLTACESCGETRQEVANCNQDPPPPACVDGGGDTGQTTYPPVIPNGSFNSYHVGAYQYIFIPDAWVSNCTWGFNLYGGAYGEPVNGAMTGAVLFPVPGCSIFSQVAPADPGSAAYQVVVRHRNDATRDPDYTTCSNCLLVTASWVNSSGGTISESYGYVHASSTWTTTSFPTSKPSTATGLRIEIATIASPGDDVYVDSVSIQ